MSVSTGRLRNTGFISSISQWIELVVAGALTNARRGTTVAFPVPYRKPDFTSRRHSACLGMYACVYVRSYHAPTIVRAAFPCHGKHAPLRMCTRAYAHSRSHTESALAEMFLRAAQRRRAICGTCVQACSRLCHPIGVTHSLLNAFSSGSW